MLIITCTSAPTKFTELHSGSYPPHDCCQSWATLPVPALLSVVSIGLYTCLTFGLLKEIEESTVWWDSLYSAESIDLDKKVIFYVSQIFHL